MNDTVTKLMDLADALAQEVQDFGYLDNSPARKRLQDELVKLLTPLKVDPVHKHEWFRTGAMEPGVCRCIHCGEWGRESMHGITGESK